MKNYFRVSQIILGLLIFSTIAAASSRTPANVQSMVDSQMLPLPQAVQSNMVDGKKFPRLWLGSIRWEQPIETATYNVDAALSPGVDLRFTFQLTPHLRTPDHDIRDMKEGYYILRMVLLRPPILDEQPSESEKSDKKELSLYRRYIAGSERLVQLDQGAIRTTITFHLQALSATAMRNTLLIQMLPVKSSSLQRLPNGLIRSDSTYELSSAPNYLANVIRIPFMPRQSSGLVTPADAVITDDVNSEEESLDLGAFTRQCENIANYTRAQTNKPQMPNTIAKQLGLEYLQTDDPRLESLLSTYNHKELFSVTSLQLATQIEQITQNTPLLKENMAASFCRLLSANMNLGRQSETSAQLIRSHMFLECLAKPEQHFSLIRQIHIQDISNRAKDTQHLSGSLLRLNLNSNFGTNRVRTNDVLSGVHQGFNPIDIMGVLRMGYTYNVNEVNSRTKFQGTMVSSGVDLEISQWDMGVVFNSYIPCLMVVPNKNEKIWVGAKERKGFYLCNKLVNSHPLSATERFYHVYPTATTSTVLDLLNPKNQPVNMVLRGQRDYFTFLKSIQKYVTPRPDQNKNIAQELREAAAIYRGSIPSIPTVLSYPVMLTGPQIEKRLNSQTSPTFWNQFFHQYEENFD